MDLIPDFNGGLYAGLRLGGMARVQADGAVVASAGPALGLCLSISQDTQWPTLGVGNKNLGSQAGRLTI